MKEKSTNAKGSSNHISALPSQSRFGHVLDADADVGAALYFSLAAITAMSAFRDVIARKLLLNSTLEKLSSSRAGQGRARPAGRFEKKTMALKVIHFSTVHFPLLSFKSKEK